MLKHGANEHCAYGAAAKAWAYNVGVNPLAMILVAVTVPAVGQLIQVGPTDPHYCEKVEQVRPNLVLSGATHLSGRIIDQSGAPVKDSLVELRLYKSESEQISVKKVRTDQDGRFYLDLLAKGRYRLLASPTRVFRQAEKLECGDRDPCTLLITLRASPTDQPDMFCPVR
jgi:hypothetical protein